MTTFSNGDENLFLLGLYRGHSNKGESCLIFNCIIGVKVPSSSVSRNTNNQPSSSFSGYTTKLSTSVGYHLVSCVAITP